MFFYTYNIMLLTCTVAKKAFSRACRKGMKDETVGMHYAINL